MKKITENRILVWLMFAPFLFLFGLPVLVGWTVIQLVIYDKDKKKYDYYNTPLQDRPEIIEMNKPENLTAEDIDFFKTNKQYTKEQKWGHLKINTETYAYIDERRKGR